MAFLGSLGKALGLDREFSLGFVEGVTKSIDRGIQSDMKATQKNIDDLTKIAFESTATDKKRFEKELKENTKLVEEIVANMGGADGMNNPLAPVAAQSLISQLGLNQAVSQSRDYKKNFTIYGADPIQELQLNKKLNGDVPTISLSALAKSTVSPISGVDMSQLGDSANVGFMKANFFGGAQDSTKEIKTRTDAMLKAAGVDMDDTLGDKLPTAIKVKLDPLILGMQDNPKAEELRLVTMLKSTDREENPDLHAKIKEKIDLTRSIIQETTPKKGLSLSETNSSRNELISIVGNAFGISTKPASLGNPFTSFTDEKEKNLLALKSVNYYMKKLQESRINSGRDDQYNNYAVILQAATEGKKIIETNINGIYSLEVANESFYNDDELVLFAVNREGGQAKTDSGTGVKDPKQVEKQQKQGDTKVTINTLLPKLKEAIAGGDSRIIVDTKTQLIEAIMEEYNIKGFKEAQTKLTELMGNITS